MRTKQRAHSLVRTVILFSSVLAIVGVLFAVVQYLDNQVAPPRKNASSRTSTPAKRPPLTTQPAEDSSWLPIEKTMPAVGTGKKSRLSWYTPDSDVARMEILVSEWKPIPNRENEVEVISPEIYGRTPSGQDIRVTADRGIIRMKKIDDQAQDPQYGNLTGNVRIEWDLLKEEERKKLSPELQNAPPPAERMVVATFEDIEFDFDAARMRTTGAFHVQSERAEIKGEGLTVRYNQLTGRLVRLSVDQGESITLRKLGRSLKIALPGETSSQMSSSLSEELLPVDQEEEKKSEPKEVILNPGDEDIPWLVPKKEKNKKRKPAETYHAVFSGDVKVAQGKDPQGNPLSGIKADSLDFVFDIGPRQRNRNWANVGAESKQNTEATTRSTVQDDPKAEDPEVVLTWTGPFMVEFVGERPEGVEAERLHVKADGNPVQVWDRQGNASCGTLEYKDETKQIKLRAGKAKQVMVEARQSGRMTGQELFFDQLKGSIRIAGPGVLTDKRTAVNLGTDTSLASGDKSRTEIRFMEELDAVLEETEYDVIDKITGETIRKRQEYIRSAHLKGQVDVSLGESAIQGDEVKVTFAEPDEGDEASDRIKELYAKGNVQLNHGNREIRCTDYLTVLTSADKQGRVSPHWARAVGDVEASEGDQKITAGDQMEVKLRKYEKPKPPFDLTRARAMAINKGADPDTIDWDQKQREYEAEPLYEPGVQELVATGGVTIREPGRNLNVECQDLECTFIDGRNIQAAKVVGPKDGSAASVEFGAYSVLGHLIDLDVMNEKAHVPGKGRLTFTSVKDLDGKKLDEPRAIAVTWTKDMEFRGDRNVAVFDGMVHASSQDSSFDCQKMVIDFDDVEEVIEPEPEESMKDFWFVGKYLFAGSDESQEDPDSPVRQFNKEPTFMTATGNVVALVANHDKQTNDLRGRMCIKAPAMDIDLKHQLMSIEDAGTLLIEDYRKRTPQDRKQRQNRSPFGGLVGSNASQTYLKWGDTMSYNFRDHTASFNTDVELRHRSGENILLASGPVTGAEESMKDKKGRNALLQCKSLLVQFLAKKDNKSGNSSGLGRMSGFDLDKFNADGKVYFEDSGVSAFANRVTFDREQELLSILGTEEVPAEVYDQRDNYRHITGPRIYWYRTTNRIEAPDAIIRQR